MVGGMKPEPTLCSPLPSARTGLVAAGCILLCWTGSLVALLGLGLPLLLAPVGVAIMAFAYTGLFITAHDAMHGSVAPRNPRLNHAVGALAVWLYASFSYSALQQAHAAHHAHPAQPTTDPDFHDGDRPGPLAWYLGFMGRYATLRQLGAQGVAFFALFLGLGLPLHRVLLFWVLPALLSSLQLFWFGTYLPHRGQDKAPTGPHRARSSTSPRWLSFLACYHFDYHHEHHAHPNVPWWGLPGVRERLATAVSQR